MTIQETSTKIIEYLGGKNNIISYTHCATRLRFNLRDANKADMDAIKKIRRRVRFCFSRRAASGHHWSKCRYILSRN